MIGREPTAMETIEQSSPPPEEVSDVKWDVDDEDLWTEFLEQQDPYTRKTMPELKSLDAFTTEIVNVESKIVDVKKEIADVKKEIANVESKIVDVKKEIVDEEQLDQSLFHKRLVAFQHLLTSLIEKEASLNDKEASLNEKEASLNKSRQDLLNFRQKFIAYGDQATRPATLQLLKSAAKSGKPPSGRTRNKDEAYKLWESIRWTDGPKFPFKCEYLVEKAVDLFNTIKGYSSHGNTEQAFNDIPKKVISTIKDILWNINPNDPAYQRVLDGEPSHELMVELKRCNEEVENEHYLFPFCEVMHSLYDTRFSPNRKEFCSSLNPISVLGTITIFEKVDKLSVGWSVHRITNLRARRPTGECYHGIIRSDEFEVVLMLRRFISLLVE